MELTILGGRGFIGTHYRSLFPYRVSNGRDDYHVVTKDVLYFISTVHNYNVFTQPHLDIGTNLSTLIDVLESWRAHPDSKNGVFNFVSSWFVYGQQDQPHGVPETAECHPKGFYSITKRCAEQLLMSYCETYGLKYRILRLGNVVGPGDLKVSAQKNALQHIIGQMKRHEVVQIYGDGKFFRDYIYVTDCVKAINLAITKGAENAIYNIGNGKPWLFYDIIVYLHERMKSMSEVVHITPKEFHRAVQVWSCYLDNTKIQALGYVPEYTGAKLYDALI